MPTQICSRVHNEETTVQYDPIPSYGQSLRHSCRPAFDSAMQVYSILDERKNHKRDERLRYCRGMAWFYRHIETGEVRVGSNACHLRWCPVCAQARRNYIAHSVAEWVGIADHPKFLTLTLKHTNAPLTWQIDNLYKYFRELRRRKEFAESITGGIWFFQIKKSGNTNQWHPHLHCLVTGLYFSKRKLHKIWCQITYGSFVADIRSVHDPQKAANDAARYAACPGSLVELSHSDGCELVEAMHGRRICGTWGTGRAVPLRPPKQTDKDKWKNVGSWDIVLNTRDSDPNARAILNAWKDKKPLEAGIDCCRVDDTNDVPDGIPEEQLVFDEIYSTERSPP